MKTGTKIMIGVGVALTIGVTIFLISRKKRKDAEAKLGADGPEHWNALGTRSQFQTGFKSDVSMMNAIGKDGVINVSTGAKRSDGVEHWNSDGYKY